jgi:hypothetical protein
VVKKEKSKFLTVLVLVMSMSSFAQTHNHDHDEDGGHADHVENGTHVRTAPTEKQLDSLLNKFKVSEEHAEKFGRLVIQDAGGRMKPINTFSSELLRKVSHSNEYKGMNPDQVFLSISQYAQFWIEIPLIYMKGGMIASVKS